MNILRFFCFFCDFRDTFKVFNDNANYKITVCKSMYMLSYN